MRRRYRSPLPPSILLACTGEVRHLRATHVAAGSGPDALVPRPPSHGAPAAATYRRRKRGRTREESRAFPRWRGENRRQEFDDIGTMNDQDRGSATRDSSFALSPIVSASSLMSMSSREGQLVKVAGLAGLSIADVVLQGLEPLLVECALRVVSLVKPLEYGAWELQEAATALAMCHAADEDTPWRRWMRRPRPPGLVRLPSPCLVVIVAYSPYPVDVVDSLPCPVKAFKVFYLTQCNKLLPGSHCSYSSYSIFNEWNRYEYLIVLLAV